MQRKYLRFMTAYRVEHDSMGDVRVPAGSRWGAQTQRAVDNFPISGRPIAPVLIRALGMIKAEAARVNKLPKAIADAAEEVVAGVVPHHSPLPPDPIPHLHA